MPSIRETRVETVQMVLPEHANTLGNLYGGRLMFWMTHTASLAASRFARGPAVLGSMDDIDFLTPVRIGEIVILQSQVEFVGQSSMEVGVAVVAEDPETGGRKVTTLAHMAYVAVDAQGRPRPLPYKIKPADPWEEQVFQRAKERRTRRQDRLRMLRHREIPSLHPLVASSISRLVFPEDAVFGNLMFAGKLMMHLDEFSSIVAIRHARGVVVTAAIDSMDFFHPIRVGHILVLEGGITHVGRSSMEIAVDIFVEHPRTGDRVRSSRAYLTFVHLDHSGRPKPLPPLRPQTPEQRCAWEEAEIRREARKRRKAQIQERLGQLLEEFTP